MSYSRWDDEGHWYIYYSDDYVFVGTINSINRFKFDTKVEKDNTINTWKALGEFLEMKGEDLGKLKDWTSPE